MAIEKSLYAAPQGLEDLMGSPQIEIEIESLVEQINDIN